MNEKLELTLKELQLLKLIAKDYSRKQAAVALDINTQLLINEDCLFV